MKKLLKLFAKNIAIQFISFLFIIGMIALAANINWPNQTPDGETTGGKIQNYFNKILVNTGTTTDGKVKNSDKLDGYDHSAFIKTETDPKIGTLTSGKLCDNNGTKINCTKSSPVNQKCAEGYYLEGFDSAGNKICKVFTLNNGVFGGYKFYIDGYTNKKMFGIGVIKNNKFYGITYCDPETVHGSCGYSTNIDCSTNWTSYQTQESCTYFYGATFMKDGLYRYKVSVNGLKINTITQEW